ncbi:hypothetical protein [Tessaracoccus defluvii]|uniref:Uncharacterized protein n=1 Tax=Tessaracoccus defluvii TaxID=1285901 RepID=A0A7H0H2S4_9ACTN|nr:hypothetical protein [Tessaracoccus defluvii]QNP54840.1 hypothetical protein H9L22_11065 [Tessaracoccus defluvii]
MTSERSLAIEPSGLGVVSLGREQHAPAGAATVSLLGCLVTVDPCTPEEPPHCLVSDPGSAAVVIEALYGPAVARRLTELDDRSDGPEEVPFTAGRELDVVIRLGTVRWLRSNSPLPLDHGLLELEECVLLGQIAELLDPLDELWLDSLVDMGPHLLRLADEREFRPEGLADVVADGLELLANHLPVADRLRLDAASRLARWSTPPGSPHTPTFDAGRLSRELAPVGALHAGAESSLYVGTSTVGWGDVPVGTTSRAERNVQWTLQIEDEDATLSVGVEAAEPVLTHPALGRAPRRIDTLAFDLLLPGWPFPVAAGRLRPEGPAEAWVGQARLETPARAAVTAAIGRGKAITIRVHGGATWPPEQPMESEAQRYAARGLSLLRLDAMQPEPSLRKAAADALHRAGNLWRHRNFKEAAKVCGSLELRAAAERTVERRVWGQRPAADDRPLPRFPISLAERWLMEATG